MKLRHKIEKKISETQSWCLLELIDKPPTRLTEETKERRHKLPLGTKESIFRGSVDIEKTKK